MSRSYKKHKILKDRPRNYKKSTAYWKRVRRKLKLLTKQGKEPINPKSIVNDYDYCDYTFHCYHECRCMKLFGRKKCMQK